MCRSFKNFHASDFLQDLETVNFNIAAFDDVNLAYDNFSKLFTEVADKHAPFKERKILPNQVPYMNAELKSAVYKKKMLYNKFQKFSSSKNWELYIDVNVIMLQKLKINL